MIFIYLSILFFSVLIFNPEYREVSAILLASSLVVSIAQMPLFVISLVDCLTGFLLVNVPHGFRQAPLLLSSILCHGLLQYDVLSGTDLIYSRYEFMIGAIIVGQMIILSDGIKNGLRNIPHRV